MVSRLSALKLLAVVEALLAVVGLASGLAMMFDPSGKDIGLSLDLLKNAPVGDFAFVGLFLFAFAGVLPAVAAYGLWTKKRWRWTDAVNKWTGQNWAWTATVTLGIVLLLWIGVELISVGPLTGIGGVMQIIITLMGLLILGLVTRPSMRFDMKLEGRSRLFLRIDLGSQRLESAAKAQSKEELAVPHSSCGASTLRAQ